MKRNKPVRTSWVAVVRNTAVSLSFVFGAWFSCGAALASPGDSVQVYRDDPDNPYATFMDTGTGQTYEFSLLAQEFASADFRGSTTFVLKAVPVAGRPNGSMQLCTTHGTHDVSLNQNPLPTVQCGNAGAQRVKIHGCTAEVEAHGYIHADHPQPVVYMGTITVEVRYQKTGKSDDIQVTIYTPKEKIKLAGKVVGQTVTMPSCQ